MSGNGGKDPAKDKAARKQIKKIVRLGKTGAVKKAFEKKYGKKKGK